MTGCDWLAKRAFVCVHCTLCKRAVVICLWPRLQPHHMLRVASSAALTIPPSPRESPFSLLPFYLSCRQICRRRRLGRRWPISYSPRTLVASPVKEACAKHGARRCPAIPPALASAKHFSAATEAAEEKPNTGTLAATSTPPHPPAH